MNFIDALVKKLLPPKSQNNTTSEQVHQINTTSIDDIQKSKSKKVVKSIYIFLAILIGLFIIQGAVKSFLKYKEVVKEENAPKKPIIPELNLTQKSDLRFQMAEAARLDDIQKQVTENQIAQQHDLNKSMEEIKSLIKNNGGHSTQEASNNQQIGQRIARATPQQRSQLDYYAKKGAAKQKRASVRSGNKQTYQIQPLASIAKRANKTPQTLEMDDLLQKQPGSQQQQKVLSQQQIAQSSNQLSSGEMPIKQAQHYSSSNGGIVPVMISTGTSSSTNYTENKEEAAIPTFSMMKGYARGTLTTGFSAPTLAMGKNEPQPVFISLDSKIRISDGREMDARDCTLLAAATGNINTSRAEVRVSEIECIIRDKYNHDYRVAEKVDGWVYGEDGVYGLKGRLVSSEGKVIDAALPLMAIEAVVGAVKNSSTTTTSVSGLGSVTSTSGSAADGMRQGAVTGFEKGADKLIDYYIKVLDAMNPFIEVKGARRVVVAFKGNAKLKVEKFVPLNVSNTYEGGK